MKTRYIMALAVFPIIVWALGFNTGAKWMKEHPTAQPTTRPTTQPTTRKGATMSLLEELLNEVNDSRGGYRPDEVKSKIRQAFKAGRATILDNLIDTLRRMREYP